MNRFYKMLLGAALALACGALLLPTPVEAQSMSRREIRYNMKKARTAFKRRQFEKASRLLFDIVENGGESPKSQRSARYNLARALVQLKLHLVALDYNITVLSKTPVKSRSSRFVRAMRNLIRIADAIDDETLIMQLFGRIPKLRAKLPPNQDPVIGLLRNRKYVNKAWWGAFHQKMAYLMGRYNFLKAIRGSRKSGKTALRFLALVKPVSSGFLYPKALYLRGVLTSTYGKHKKAIGTFRQIMNMPVPRKGGGVLFDIKAQAQYGIARTLYARARIAQIRNTIDAKKFTKKNFMGLFTQALVEYDKIPKQRGIFQAQVLFESAYTYFMMEKYHFSLGKLLALSSPFYRRGFFPELEILRALIYFKTCKYEDTKQTMINFRKQYQPLQKKLTRLLSYRKTKKWRHQYYDFYITESKKLKANAKTKIPASIIASISKEKALKGFSALLRKVQAELQIIRGKSGGWRESNVGKALLKRAIGLRGIMRRRAGGSIYFALRLLRNEINKQVNQSRIIQLETLQNQKKELLRYAEGGGIEQDEFRYTIVTEQSHIYWPYQGEYWRDEVGYYRQFIQGECKQ